MSAHWILIALLSLASAKGGLDQLVADSDRRIIDAVLAIPETEMFREHEAFSRLAKEPEVLPVIGRALPGLTEEQQMRMERFLHEMGMEGAHSGDLWRRHGGLTRSDVVQVMVAAMGQVHRNVRVRIIGTLTNYCSDDLVRAFGNEIVSSIEKTKEGPIASRLLGMTGCSAARRFLESNPVTSDSDDYDLALAKLGDTRREQQFLDAFRHAKTTGERAGFAVRLGYIATPGAVVALALHLRSDQAIPNPPFGSIPLRQIISEALERAMPLDEVFWPARGAMLSDEYYLDLEEWASETLGIQWSGKRGQLPVFRPRESPGGSAPRVP